MIPDAENDDTPLREILSALEAIQAKLDSYFGSGEPALNPNRSKDTPGASFMVRTDPIEDPTPGVERLGNKRAPLPDPRLIRQIIRFRQLRNRFFPEDIFSDPAWDMLLDLTVAHIEHDRVSVTSLCIASGVPPTTALRWIGLMVSNGLFMRYEDSQDRRRSFIALSDRGAQLMADYFSKIPKNSQYII